MKKNTTINDIALAAGVSKATVSRYINGNYHLMSEDTRKRIQTIVDVTQYQPSSAARSLKTKRSYLIGVVVSDISTPFTSSLILGISNALDGTGYMPLFVNCNGDAKKEEEYLKIFINRGVDGLLVNSSSYENPYLIELAAKGVPVVLCDRHVKDYSFEIVAHELDVPVLKTLEHLYEQGFSAVYLFTQPLASSSVRLFRYQAFLKNIKAVYGTERPEDFVRHVNINEPSKTREAVAELLKGSGTPAIIGINTMTTIHVLSEMKAMGLRSPYDIGICGTDDWNWKSHADWTSLIEPGITTLGIDSMKVGTLAAERLLKRISDPKTPKEQILLPSELTIRKSTLLRDAEPA